MEDFLLKVIPTALGASLGFLFGLAALQIKERVDLQKRITSFVTLMHFSAKGLADVLNMPPDRAGLTTAGAVISHIDVIAYRIDLASSFSQFYDIYVSWTKGLYLPGSPRETLVSSHADELMKIARRFTLSGSI